MEQLERVPVRCRTQAIDEAEASALVSSGLKAEGFDYINQDDGWYQMPEGVLQRCSP